MISPVEQASAKRADTAGGELEAMTKAELLTYAQKSGIKGVNGAMLKSEILSVIKGES